MLPNSIKIAEATTLLGFDSSYFLVDTSGFQNPSKGTWSVASRNGAVYLEYSGVPELDATTGGGALAFLVALLTLARERGRSKA